MQLDTNNGTKFPFRYIVDCGTGFHSMADCGSLRRAVDFASGSFMSMPEFKPLLDYVPDIFDVSIFLPSRSKRFFDS